MYGYAKRVDVSGSCEQCVGGLVCSTSCHPAPLPTPSHPTSPPPSISTANGTVLDLMSSCRKDATGFPLRSLFVGSEGTLGVITGASVACVPRPVSHSVMFLAAEGWGQVLGTLAAARRDLGGLLR